MIPVMNDRAIMTTNTFASVTCFSCLCAKLAYGPAKMVFVDGVEGESTITHHSNSWPEIRVMDPEDSLADYLLMFGRLITFNTIKTKKGWVWAGGIAALFGVMQTYYIGSAIVQKRRRIKALEDVKKM